MSLSSCKALVSFSGRLKTPSTESDGEPPTAPQDSLASIPFKKSCCSDGVRSFCPGRNGFWPWCGLELKEVPAFTIWPSQNAAVEPSVSYSWNRRRAMHHPKSGSLSFKPWLKALPNHFMAEQKRLAKCLRFAGGSERWKAGYRGHVFTGITSRHPWPVQTRDHILHSAFFCWCIQVSLLHPPTFWRLLLWSLPGRSCHRIGFLATIWEGTWTWAVDSHFLACCFSTNGELWEIHKSIAKGETWPNQAPLAQTNARERWSCETDWKQNLETVGCFNLGVYLSDFVMCLPFTQCYKHHKPSPLGFASQAA